MYCGSVCTSTLKCFIIDFGFIYRAQINHITTVTVKANPFKLIKENYFMRLTNVLCGEQKKEKNVSFPFSASFAQPLEHGAWRWKYNAIIMLQFENKSIHFFGGLLLFVQSTCRRCCCCCQFHKCFCSIDFVKSMRDTLCGCGVWMVTRIVHDLEACHRFRHWIACKNAIKSIYNEKRKKTFFPSIIVNSWRCLYWMRLHIRVGCNNKNHRIFRLCH